MNIISSQNLARSIDDESLVFQEKSLVCHAGHSYDISKFGYIDRLIYQYKISKQTGGGKDRFVARSRR